MTAETFLGLRPPDADDVNPPPVFKLISLLAGEGVDLSASEIAVYGYGKV